MDDRDRKHDDYLIDALLALALIALLVWLAVGHPGVK